MNSTSLDWPPPFTLRRSNRARYIRLQIQTNSGLELIVPRFSSKKQALEFLQSKRHWIEKHLHLLKDQSCETLAKRFELPYSIELKFLSCQWDICYHHLTESERVVLKPIDDRLIFSGEFTDFAPCIPVIKRWIKSQAQQHLQEYIMQLSRECDLGFCRVSYRSQKTRWGSCSSDRNINLNVKLLFLPRHQVRYVIIHELCHTVHLNHSALFWNLVKQHEPDYKILRHELKNSDHYIPAWF